jgi:hypothetical protein
MEHEYIPQLRRIFHPARDDVFLASCKEAVLVEMNCRCLMRRVSDAVFILRRQIPDTGT